MKFSARQSLSARNLWSVDWTSLPYRSHVEPQVALSRGSTRAALSICQCTLGRNAIASMRGQSGVRFLCLIFFWRWQFVRVVVVWCRLSDNTHWDSSPTQIGPSKLTAYRSARRSASTSGPGVHPLIILVAARGRLALAHPACSPAPPNRIGSHMPVGREARLLWSCSLALVRGSSFEILLRNRCDRKCNHRAGPSSSAIELPMR